MFVARGGIAELTPTILTTDDVRDLVERMLKSSGRRVDLSSPFVDATLPDGLRLVQCRPPSLAGTGEVPRRSLDLLIALNSGVRERD